MPGTDFNALDNETFRQQWRNWIAGHYTSALRNPLKRLTGPDAKHWLRSQRRDGWRAPALPKEHGGMGLSFPKQLLLRPSSIPRITPSKWFLRVAPRRLKGSSRLRLAQLIHLVRRDVARFSSLAFTA